MCHQHTVFVSVLNRQCDVIVEVCHPNIVKEFGTQFLSRAHVMVRNWFFMSLILLSVESKYVNITGNC